MATLKQGDPIKNEDGKTCKVLGVCGEVIHISYPYDHDIYEDTYTESFLKNQGYTWDTPAWEPKDGGDYWFISVRGQASFCEWNNDDIDHARRDFLGAYQTKELCEAALLEIRRKLGK
jgi:hypothetical protein